MPAKPKKPGEVVKAGELAEAKPRKSRPGRKPLPPGQKREDGISVTLLSPERALIDQAAELDHDKTYGWSRRMLLIAAEYRVQGITIQEAYAAALALKQKK